MAGTGAEARERVGTFPSSQGLSLRVVLPYVKPQ